MKSRLLACAISVLLLTPALADGQTLSDFCHVYVIDVKAARAAAERYPTGDDKEDAKLLTAGVTVLGKFSPTIAEEELTTKVFKIPRTGLLVTASIFYTDESMFSKKLSTADSMLIGLAVSSRAYKNALSARNAAVTEIPYTENTDVVRTRTYVSVRGRDYIVSVECHCQREKEPELKQE